jgi:hypothetical protein
MPTARAAKLPIFSMPNPGTRANTAISCISREYPYVSAG